MNRFSLSISKDQILDRFPGCKIKGKYFINYNIGCSDPAYILTNDEKDTLQPAIWGMVTGNQLQNPFLCVDYRNVHVSPSFRLPFRLNRCLVVADGFFVWNAKVREPYFIQNPEKGILTLPGIYKPLELNQGGSILCFAVICDLNFKINPPAVFDSPISISTGDAKKWLSDLTVLEAVALLKRNLNEEWQVNRVSNKVLIKEYNRPEVKKFLKPIPSLFN